MPKRAVSVTLDVDNLIWLRAQAGAGRNVSRIVNELVSEARAVGRRFGAATRSVAGKVALRGYDTESGPACRGEATLEVFDSPTEELTRLAPREMIGGYWRSVGTSWNGGTTLEATPR